MNADSGKTVSDAHDSDAIGLYRGASGPSRSPHTRGSSLVPAYGIRTSPEIPDLERSDGDSKTDCQNSADPSRGSHLHRQSLEVRTIPAEHSDRPVAKGIPLIRRPSSAGFDVESGFQFAPAPHKAKNTNQSRPSTKPDVLGPQDTPSTRSLRSNDYPSRKPSPHGIKTFSRAPQGTSQVRDPRKPTERGSEHLRSTDVNQTKENASPTFSLQETRTPLKALQKNNQMTNPHFADNDSSTPKEECHQRDARQGKCVGGSSHVKSSGRRSSFFALPGLDHDSTTQNALTSSTDHQGPYNQRSISKGKRSAEQLDRLVSQGYDSSLNFVGVNKSSNSAVDGGDNLHAVDDTSEGTGLNGAVAATINSGGGIAIQERATPTQRFAVEQGVRRPPFASETLNLEAQSIVTNCLSSTLDKMNGGCGATPPTLEQRKLAPTENRRCKSTKTKPRGNQIAAPIGGIQTGGDLLLPESNSAITSTQLFQLVTHRWGQEQEQHVQVATTLRERNQQILDLTRSKDSITKQLELSRSEILRQEEELKTYKTNASAYKEKLVSLRTMVQELANDQASLRDDARRLSHERADLEKERGELLNELHVARQSTEEDATRMRRWKDPSTLWHEACNRIDELESTICVLRKELDERDGLLTTEKDRTIRLEASLQGTNREHEKLNALLSGLEETTKGGLEELKSTFMSPEFRAEISAQFDGVFKVLKGREALDERSTTGLERLVKACLDGVSDRFGAVVTLQEKNLVSVENFESWMKNDLKLLKSQFQAEGSLKEDVTIIKDSSQIMMERFHLHQDTLATLHRDNAELSISKEALTSMDLKHQVETLNLQPRDSPEIMERLKDAETKVSQLLCQLQIAEESLSQTNAEYTAQKSELSYLRNEVDQTLKGLDIANNKVTSMTTEINKAEHWAKEELEKLRRQLESDFDKTSRLQTKKFRDEIFKISLAKDCVEEELRLCNNLVSCKSSNLEFLSKFSDKDYNIGKLDELLSHSADGRNGLDAKVIEYEIQASKTDKVEEVVGLCGHTNGIDTNFHKQIAEEIEPDQDSIAADEAILAKPLEQEYGATASGKQVKDPGNHSGKLELDHTQVQVQPMTGDIPESSMKSPEKVLQMQLSTEQPRVGHVQKIVPSMAPSRGLEMHHTSPHSSSTSVDYESLLGPPPDQNGNESNPWDVRRQIERPQTAPKSDKGSLIVTLPYKSISKCRVKALYDGDRRTTKSKHFEHSGLRIAFAENGQGAVGPPVSEEDSSTVKPAEQFQAVELSKPERKGRKRPNESRIKYCRLDAQHCVNPSTPMKSSKETRVDSSSGQPSIHVDLLQAQINARHEAKQTSSAGSVLDQANRYRKVVSSSISRPQSPKITSQTPERERTFSLQRKTRSGRTFHSAETKMPKEPEQTSQLMDNEVGQQKTRAASKGATKAQRGKRKVGFSQQELPTAKRSKKGSSGVKSDSKASRAASIPPLPAGSVVSLS
ncbi:MAG: hypothetical protein M1837_005467 [Sclerophora amabilis]|nr:MAG: hypothetical protein M1837_005467 [Sclerophora amabilis]